jgi:hypothetical protein
MLGLICVPVSGAAARSAEARLGRKVVKSIGSDEAGALVARFGPQLDGLTTTQIADCCSADFREGRTLLVGGVMVARTEAVAWLLAAGVRPA